MRYDGPAKPIPLDPMRHSPWERIERVVFLLCLAVIACDVLSWRPYRDWETDRKSTRLNSSHRL